MGGVTLDVYRCRIGTFNPHGVPRAHVSTGVQSDSVGLPSLCLPVAVLCALLLISGIEPNPGPDHVCKYCKASFKSTVGYFKHCSMHKSERTSKIKCSVPRCPGELTTLASLYAHLSREHSTPRSIPVIRYLYRICPVASCGENLYSRDTFMKHIAQAHFLQGHCEFVCAYEGCKYTCRNLSGFRNHMSRVHPAEFEASPAELHLPPPSFEDERYDFQQDNNFEDLTSATEDEVFPDHAVKHEIAKFYLKLEAVHNLATKTVQYIAEEVSLITELSHHCLKLALRQQLNAINLDKDVIESVVGKTFKFDTVFNVHHKYEDVEQLGTHHLRMQHWKKYFPYVEPREIYLGLDEVGKKKYAHYVSIKESLNILLGDKRIKEAVLKSFSLQSDPEILQDFTDGTAFLNHSCHNAGTKCIKLKIFQDGFDANAFGADSGRYKPLGFYYMLGNLPPAYRSKVDLIQLVYLVFERYLKTTIEEEVQGINKWQVVLKPLLDELNELQSDGIMIDGEKYKVCCLFLIGDSLGQHQIGSYVRNFSSSAFFCRFCPVPRADFLEKPYEVKEPRRKEDYDAAVDIAKRKWQSILKTSLKAQEKARKTAKKQEAAGSRAQSKRNLEAPISKSAYKRLVAVNYKGVKYHPSAMNSENLHFHVTDDKQPPCLGHDLFEGVVKKIVGKVLQHCSETKGWFDLNTINRRIKSFKYKNSDLLDSPAPLKSFDDLKGSACENWTFLRLLPFIIGDLIQDPSDPFWTLYLQLKELCEYVCAPKITRPQVAYLKILIGSYLCSVKELLPECLTPKHHFLCHYPDLIIVYGPLIRLWTLRFESRHMFFKQVIRTCRNYINLTYTMVRNFVCRFAYDHSAEILPSDLSSQVSHALNYNDLEEEMKAAVPIGFCNDVQVLKHATLNGISYKEGDYMLMGTKDLADLNVGCIVLVLLKTSTNTLHLLLKEKLALNSFNGLYKVQCKITSFKLKSIDDLPDYYPLPSYDSLGEECLSLKHSIVRT